MVREARFSWDDADGREPLLRHDRVDPFDDELFDDPLIPPASDHSSGGTPHSPQKQRRREPESERRHLAGAHWMNERPQR